MPIPNNPDSQIATNVPDATAPTTASMRLNFNTAKTEIEALVADFNTLPAPSPGPQGPQGATGNTGNNGNQGARGATGDTGNQGPPGPTGDAGSAGDEPGTVIIANLVGDGSDDLPATAADGTMAMDLAEGFKVYIAAHSGWFVLL